MSCSNSLKNGESKHFCLSTFSADHTGPFFTVKGANAIQQISYFLPKISGLLMVLHNIDKTDGAENLKMSSQNSEFPLKFWHQSSD